MNEKDISNKLKRFDHEINHLLKDKKYNKDELTNLNNIKSKIKSLKDPYDRKDVKLKKVIINESFPRYIVENMGELNEFIMWKFLINLKTKLKIFPETVSLQFLV